jgi:YesN/AraC family two-component response regulator
LDKPLVACIDDEPYILHSLHRILRAEQCRLFITTSPSELLYFVQEEEVALVISDYRMEEITGLDLLKRVRVHSPGSHRAILSGYADQRLIDHALSNGDVNDYLLKPFERDKIRSYVQQVLRLS